MTKKLKIINSNVGKFCLMPWIHFHMDTTGKVKACCSTQITYGQLSESSDQNSIRKIWNGRSAKAFRKKLLAGESDRRCSVCYKREAAGKNSMRTETLEKYGHLVESAIKNTDEAGHTTMKPAYLDLRFSNVCNLKCRTCWHGASSSWFEDARVLGNNISEKAIVYATTDNKKVLDHLLQESDELLEIYFAGGEPLMMEEHYMLLDQLIASKKNSVLLRYNTNLSLTTFKGRAIAGLWRLFPNVQLSVSVDAMEGLGEYIRKGMKWSAFIENFRLIRKTLPHIKMEIAPTVSILNIHRLADMHRYFVEAGLTAVNEIYLNLLERPYAYNIKTLPDEAKSKLTAVLLKHITWISNKNGSDEVKGEFEAVISYLNTPESIEKSNLFALYNEKLDDIRGERLENSHPDLFKSMSD